MTDNNNSVRMHRTVKHKSKHTTAIEMNRNENKGKKKGGNNSRKPPEHHSIHIRSQCECVFCSYCGIDAAFIPFFTYLKIFSSLTSSNKNYRRTKFDHIVPHIIASIGRRARGRQRTKIHSYFCC